MHMIWHDNILINPHIGKMGWNIYKLLPGNFSEGIQAL